MSITITELKNRWKIDCLIDDLNLQKASSDSPRIHARYLEYLMDSKIELKKAVNRCIELRALLIKYYSGNFTKKDLDETGWDQYQGKKPLKGEMENLIQAFPEYLELENRVTELEIIIDSLEAIMKMIYQRSFDIKNIIQTRIFESGA